MKENLLAKITLYNLKIQTRTVLNIKNNKFSKFIVFNKITNR